LGWFKREAAGIDYPQLVYLYLKKKLSLATPIPNLETGGKEYGVGKSIQTHSAHCRHGREPAIPRLPPDAEADRPPKEPDEAAEPPFPQWCEWENLLPPG
jgi:hypothetical protein